MDKEALSGVAAYLARRFAKDGEGEAFYDLFVRLAQAWQEGHTTLRGVGEVFLSYPLLCSHEEALSGKKAFLVRDGDSLALYRFWQMERFLAERLLERLDLPKIQYEAVLDAQLNQGQQAAVRHALSSNLTLIDGGPGTGKTRTLAEFLRAVLAKNPKLRIALTAPTGKAAKRMEESFRATWQGDWPEAMEEAKTLHRLLNISGERQSPYHQENVLPYDVVVLDEASMLSLELATALFQALDKSTRVILLGDAYQLAAVDAGAVFQDLCNDKRLSAQRVTLTESYRFSKDLGIGVLAKAVLQRDDASSLDKVIAHFSDLSLEVLSLEAYEKMSMPYQNYWQALCDGASYQDLLAVFNTYRILTPSHHGAFGTKEINRQVMAFHRAFLKITEADDFFHGLPLMVLKNDYQNGLFNGDIGLCLKEGERFVFYLGEDYPLLPLERISSDLLAPAYALSVHKSQGSEFDCVAIVVDKNAPLSLLSRELLYTAITRAKKKVDIFGRTQDMAEIAQNALERQTGLARFL